MVSMLRKQQIAAEVRREVERGLRNMKTCGQDCKQCQFDGVRTGLYGNKRAHFYPSNRDGRLQYTVFLDEDPGTGSTLFTRITANYTLDPEG